MNQMLWMEGRINALVEQVDALTQERDELNRITSIQAANAFHLAAAQAQNVQLREALEMIYDKWEDGDACQSEEGDDLGTAFVLSEEEENSILRLIPSVLNNNTAPADTAALDARLKEEANKWADTAMVHGCTYMVTKIRSMK